MLFVRERERGKIHPNEANKKHEILPFNTSRFSYNSFVRYYLFFPSFFPPFFTGFCFEVLIFFKSVVFSRLFALHVEIEVQGAEAQLITDGKLFSFFFFFFFFIISFRSLHLCSKLEIFKMCDIFIIIRSFIDY